MKKLTNWLNANKIILNNTKNELDIYSMRKNLEFEFKARLNGKKQFPTYPVKFLGKNIDQQFKCVDHVNKIAIKLNRANAMLC